MTLLPHSRLGAVAAFTALYVVLALCRALAVQNWEFIGYLIVMVTVIACLTAVDRRCRLTAGLLWSFSTWGLLHMAGGLVPDTNVGDYDNVGWDLVANLAGAILAASILRVRCRRPNPQPSSSMELEGVES